LSPATVSADGSTIRVSETDEAAAERAEVHAGRLPYRYGLQWQAPFLERVAAQLRPGIRVLDVGSGARPAVPSDQRPRGCHYVGMDVSARELERAGPGAYDEIVVGDICTPIPSLSDAFDLVLSWQVLEHVSSMRAALDNQRAALAPGGRMIAMLSGTWAIYALAARVIPHRTSIMLQTRLLGADPRDKFPARYDGCSDRSLRRQLTQSGWSSWEVVPYYKAGGYLRFSRPLLRSYLAYENWAERTGRANLATHYLVEAVA
jgi:SAM-dependent methyltransferase